MDFTKIVEKFYSELERIEHNPTIVVERLLNVYGELEVRYGKIEVLEAVMWLLMTEHKWRKCLVRKEENRNQGEILKFSEDKFLVFPKITIFCPKSGKEERGDKCFNCEHFKGVKVDAEKKLLWFECGFQESGNDG